MLGTNPALYFRDCEHCLKYFYNEETGVAPVDSDGNYLERPKRTKAPCQIPGVGCAKGSPEDPVTLTERGESILRAYRRCKLTNNWPVDESWLIDVFVSLDQLYQQIDRIESQKQRIADIQMMAASVIAK